MSKPVDNVFANWRRFSIRDLCNIPTAFVVYVHQEHVVALGYGSTQAEAIAMARDHTPNEARDLGAFYEINSEQYCLLGPRVDAHFVGTTLEVTHPPILTDVATIGIDLARPIAMSGA
jgi:hypothetical protein